MTQVAKLFPTASAAFDHMLSGWLADDSPECLAQFRQDFGLEHWEDTVRNLENLNLADTGGWQVYFSESEEDDEYPGMGFRLGDLIQDAAASIHDKMWITIWEGGTNTRVRAGLTPMRGLLIIEFADNLLQEGGTEFIYMVGEISEKQRHMLGLLYAHERRNPAFYGVKLGPSA